MRFDFFDVLTFRSNLDFVAVFIDLYFFRFSFIVTFNFLLSLLGCLVETVASKGTLIVSAKLCFLENYV